MRTVTRHRYYARNSLCANLRGAKGQMEEASRQAGELPSAKRLSRQINTLARKIGKVLDKALQYAVLPEEKVIARAKRRAKKRGK